MNKNLIRNDKGMTLVELLVSMGIFAVVMTMTVGFFITMQKMQMMYRDRANIQQEGRMAMEVFSRFTREVEKIETSNGSDSIDICVASSNSIKLTMPGGIILKFVCSNDGSNPPKRLKMASCIPSTLNPTCAGIDAPSFPYSNVSSDQISIEGFTVEKVIPMTYPKAITYKLTANQFKNGVVATGEGEKLIFSGYMVMKNEL